MMSYRVWCLSWDEDEEHGRDVVAYNIMGDYPQGRRNVIDVPNTILHDASDAAEAYADFVYRERDGYESSWPLTFRVRGPGGQVDDFEVDCQHVPEFSASPAKPAAKAPRDTSEGRTDADSAPTH